MSSWRAFGEMGTYFLPYARKERKKLGLSFLAGIGYVGFGMLEPWPTKMIFDNVFLGSSLPSWLHAIVGERQDNPFFLLNLFVFMIICIATVRGVFYYYQQLLTAKAGQVISSSVRVDLYKHLQSLSFSFHDRRRTGDCLSRLTSDIRMLREVLIGFPLTVGSEGLLMVGMTLVMAWMDWQLTLLALLIIPMLVVLLKKYRSPMRSAIRKQREREGHLSSIAAEVLGAIKVVQGFHQEESEVAKFTSSDKGSLKSGLKASRLEAKFKWASEISVAIVTAIVMSVAARRVLSGALTPGELLVFVSYLRKFNQPIKKLSRVFTRMSRGTTAGERIINMLQIEPEIQDLPNAIEAPDFEGEIRYEGVDFGYSKSKLILKKFNLQVHAGERVAIVGHTGSGKSTIASLLPRFYDPSAGRVTIDGLDLKEMTLSSLRRQIGYIFQEPILFATSISENIAYGNPDASQEEIISAAKRAKIHEIIEGMEDGYETVIGERGVTLSGGQRQCVAIARAMIKNAPIVIMDEPTSGLDLPNAKLVMSALQELMKGKTVLIISHQIETLEGVDRIIRLDKGEILPEKSLQLEELLV